MSEWLEIKIPEIIRLYRGKPQQMQSPPVSENKIYATNWITKMRFTSEAAKVWKEEVAWTVKQIHPKIGRGSEMFLEIFLTFPPSKRKRDPGNYVKPIADALTGILWDDDSGLKIIADGEIGEKWALKIRWGLK